MVHSHPFRAGCLSRVDRSLEIGQRRPALDSYGDDLLSGPFFDRS